MKKQFVYLGIFLLLFTLFHSIAAASERTIRVLIEPVLSSDIAISKQKYGVVKDFGNKFTAEMSQVNYEALQKNKNFKVSIVEQLQIYGKPSNLKTRAVIPSSPVPWGIKAVYNNSVTDSTYGGKDIIIAILDTGVDTSHPDLNDSIGKCNDFTQKRNPVSNGCADDNGHGTHVAGTALANGGRDGLGIYGIAPEAILWAYKVMGRSGSGYADDIAYAIRYAANQASGQPLVISMSLGSSSNNALIKDAVDYVTSHGVLVIAAAGNEGPSPDTIGYPAALVNVVAVTALENQFEKGTYRIADFSSRGSAAQITDGVIGVREVEVAAPGAAIESTWIGGGYNTLSGTSMATPHISGLAAKIWSENKDTKAEQIRGILKERSIHNDILGGKYAEDNYDIASGYGMPKAQ